MMITSKIIIKGPDNNNMVMMTMTMVMMMNRTDNNNNNNNDDTCHDKQKSPKYILYSLAKGIFNIS